jgi:hypothetical protein
MVCLALATAPSARADVINWNFATTAGTPTVVGGNGSIGFSNEALLPPAQAPQGSTQIVLSAVSNNSMAPLGSPDSFGLNEGHWSINLTLVDTATGAAAVIPISGQVQGTYSSVKSLLTSSFDNPGPIMMTVGSTMFTLQDFTFTTPGPANDPLPTGAVGVYVQVDSVPEPSTFLLLGIGMGVVGLTRRRYLRARR